MMICYYKINAIFFSIIYFFNVPNTGIDCKNQSNLFFNKFIYYVTCKSVTLFCFWITYYRNTSIFIQYIMQKEQMKMGQEQPAGESGNIENEISDEEIDDIVDESMSGMRKAVILI